MRTTAAYIVVSLALILGISAVAAAAPGPPAPPAPAAGVRQAPPAPVPPRAPGMPAPGVDRRMRSIPVGPTDAMSMPRRVRGQILVTAVLPADAKAVSVELFCNNALLGQKAESPYQVEFNTETVSDGPQMLKAVGLDSNGKQIWVASTKIEVMNQKPTGFGPKPAAPGAAAPRPPVAPANAPGSAPAPAAPHVPAPVKPANAPAQAANVPELGNRYVSIKHGFSIRYPAGWSSADMSDAMTPKKAGNVWVQFMPGKTGGAGLTVNVRCSRLAPGTTADVFAKFNSYVSTWERKTVLGSPAFATTTTVSPREVIHRLIVIRGGKAWMLNCVDTGGSSPEASKRIFESMVGSLTLGGSSSKKLVTVKEIKKH